MCRWRKHLKQDAIIKHTHTHLYTQNGIRVCVDVLSHSCHIHTLRYILVHSCVSAVSFAHLELPFMLTQRLADCSAINVFVVVVLVILTVIIHVVWRHSCILRGVFKMCLLFGHRSVLSSSCCVSHHHHSSLILLVLALSSQLPIIGIEETFFVSGVGTVVSSQSCSLTVCCYSY